MVERILLATLLGAIGAGCLVVLFPFLSAIVWATILVFTTWPVCVWLMRGCRLGRVGASLVMVVLTALVVVLPLALLAPTGAADANRLRIAVQGALAAGLPGAPDWLRHLPVAGAVLADSWNRWAADLSAAGLLLRPYLGLIAEQGLHLLLGIAGGVAYSLLALFVAFFFWMWGETLGARVLAVLRRIAGAEHADRGLELVAATVRGTVYGILGTAIVQGILTAFGLWASGVGEPVLLGAVAAFLAVLPIGAPLVWIPAALWLLSIGHTGWATFLAVWGVVMVSGADHIIRPVFIARGAQLPYLLTVFGVLGGIMAFGALGIFVGPVLLGVGSTLVDSFARGTGPAGTAYRASVPASGGRAEPPWLRRAPGA